MDRRQAEERVLDVVAGEDHDRPLGREIAREQRGADAPDPFEGLAVGDRAPAAGGVALRQNVRSGAAAAQCSSRSVSFSG